jgi:mono/diheme cytochrome c family protein
MSRHLMLLTCCLMATVALAKEWPSKVAPRAERGKALYETHCMSCHGAKAKGDGAATAALVADVPDFGKGYGKRKDEELVRAVMRGMGSMPAFEIVFGREEADIVVEYMGTVGLAKPKPTPKPKADPKDEADEDEADEEEQGAQDQGGGEQAAE